jgi:hypothetical protein
MLEAGGTCSAWPVLLTWCSDAHSVAQISIENMQKIPGESYPVGRNSA